MEIQPRISNRSLRQFPMYLPPESTKANNYRHPASHPASMIEQDATHRFITDTERSTWNGKASTAVATQSANGLMSSADKKKLDDLTDGEVIIQCSIPGMN